MGNGGSSHPRMANPPDGITKITRKGEKDVFDLVWELYSPDGIPEFDIIFFPGVPLDSLEDAFWKTWCARDNEELVWPKEWLSKVFPRARILAIDYYSSYDPSSGAPDLYVLGENLVQSIIHTSYDVSIPVFLVGHSLGGLILKHFIISCRRATCEREDGRIKAFLGNLRGVFYYATPHDGSRVFDTVSQISGVRVLGLASGTERGRSNEDFRSLRERTNLRAYAVVEGLPTSTKWAHNVVVVEEASARYDVDDYYIHTGADHLTVCKAKNERDPIVIGKLTQFIANAMPEATLERMPGATIERPRVLNDSVWELYSPATDHPEMEVIFFHGLQKTDYKNAVWETWRAENQTDNMDVIWPKDWLSQVFPKARILSISYNSSATGAIDIYNLGTSLVSNIIDDINYNIGQDSPVFLVGHSLGGIVIKQFILAAIAKKNSLYPHTYKKEIDRIETFLENFKGVFYYATPHGDSVLADPFSLAPWTSPTVKLLTTLYSQRGRINEEFRQLRTNLNVRTFAMAEGLPTKLGPSCHLVVVNEGSARHDVDEFYTHTTADHYTVCRAKHMSDPVVIGKLVQFITNALAAMPEAPLVPVRRPQEEGLAFGKYRSRADATENDEYVVQLNDSVWEIYSPNTVDGQPEMDIVFFHGLQPVDFENAFWKTWLAESDEDILWPKEWLPQEFPTARVFLISYSSARHVACQNDMYALGENLVNNIILDAQCDIGQKRPVVLVGHSVGGTVIKHVILSAVRKKNLLQHVSYEREIVRVEAFLGNLKGVFYFATPHGGSNVAKLARSLGDKNPLLELLEKLDIERGRINEEFRIQRRILNFRAFAVAESLPTTYKSFTDIVVPEASSRRDIDGYFVVSKNHFTICKPKSKRDSAFSKLIAFIRDVNANGGCT